MTAKTEQKSFARPDGTRAFERGAMDIPRIGDAEIGRLTPADGAGFGAPGRCHRPGAGPRRLGGGG